MHYSTVGSSERQKEEATYMLFLDFLYDCETKNSSQLIVDTQLALIVIIL